jgi:2-keto-3-deoxy-L-rhamnonate aldolase RhmA
LAAMAAFDWFAYDGDHVRISLEVLRKALFE